MSLRNRLSFAFAVPAACLLAATIGCGGTPTQISETGGAERTAEPAAGADDAAAELAAREAELARREADLALKEREQDLARREAELAGKQATPKPSTSTKPAPVAPEPPPKPAPLVVPAGTQLSAEFVSPLSTKTAKVGDRVEARLAEDLVVDGRRVALAGARLEGSVTQVVSGSKKIGGTPTLGVNFDGLELAGGGMAAISGQIVQQGKSDTAKDSAKIAGAAAAGAIIGHQIDDDKGKLIGGLLGGAAGTAAAAKTGGEVEVPAGTVVGFVLDAPVRVE
jgi:biotin carboxyl carrier protein